MCISTLLKNILSIFKFLEKSVHTAPNLPSCPLHPLLYSDSLKFLFVP